MPYIGLWEWAAVEIHPVKVINPYCAQLITLSMLGGERQAELPGVERLLVHRSGRITVRRPWKRQRNWG